MKRLSARTVVKIASDIKAKSEPKYVEEKVSTTEEATEKAKTYWLLGFTWEEIEAMLEDSQDYTEREISNAIKKSQEYAHEQLKDGPFRSIKQGQIVKLTNGESGFAVDARADHLDVQLMDGNIVKISAEYLENGSIEALSKTSKIRQAAWEMVRKADEELEKIGPDPTIELLPKPKEEFKLRMTPQLRTPPHWREYEKEHLPFTSLPEASEEVQELSELLLIIKEQKEALESQIKEIKTHTKEQLRDPEQKLIHLKKEEGEVARQLNSILGKQSFAAEQIEHVLFERFEDVLVGYRKLISQETQPPGLVSKYEKLIELIGSRVPALLKRILEELDHWEQANTFITEKVQEEVSISKPKKTKMSKIMLQALAGDLSSIWRDLNESVDRVTEEYLPEIEAIADEVDAVLQDAYMEEERMVATAAIERALKE